MELSRRIRAHSPQKSVVIMISGADLNEVEAEAKDAGIDKFVQKPLFTSTIAEIINDCLRIPAPGSAAETAGKPEDNCFAGYHILLAEDIDVNREIVQALMEPTGIAIDCAENGVAAVQMFLQNPTRYDAILMDLQMPEMDGYEATRAIRARQDIPNALTVPIIAMTANVFREDVERCLAAGMNDHLGKPLDFAEVIQKLKNYLPPVTSIL
jgi:CheY-like chemotaxis protein